MHICQQRLRYILCPRNPIVIPAREIPCAVVARSEARKRSRRGRAILHCFGCALMVPFSPPTLRGNVSMSVGRDRLLRLGLWPARHSAPHDTGPSQSQIPLPPQVGVCFSGRRDLGRGRRGWAGKIQRRTECLVPGICREFVGRRSVRVEIATAVEQAVSPPTIIIS